MAKGRRASDRRREKNNPSRDIAQALSETLNDGTSPQLDLDDETAAAVDDLRLSSQMQQQGRPRANTHERSAEAEFARALNDGGAAGESTQVLPPPDKAARDGGRLTLISGDNTGARLDVTRSPFIVGRQKDLDLTLDDDADVSRVHFRLVFQNSKRTWTIEDLDSTSGTLLNGLPLDEETRIRHGDVITFGQTELRFTRIEDLPAIEDPLVVPVILGRNPIAPAGDDEDDAEGGKSIVAPVTGTAPKPPPEEKKGKRNLVLLLLFLLFGLGVVGGGVALVVHFWPTGPSAEDMAKVDKLLDEGEKALKALKLKVAREKIEAALAIAPEHERGNSLMRLLVSEEAAQKALQQAQADYDKKKLDDALKALTKIPDSSGFAPARDRLRAKIAKERIKLELDAIEALIDNGQYDEAEKRLTAFLQRHPKNERALALLERLRRLRKVKARPPESVLRAQSAFAVGNVEQAHVLAKVDSDRGVRAAVRYVSELSTFERHYKDGLAALRKKKGSKALTHLEEAYKRVPYLSGHRKNAVYKLKVGTKLGDALYLVALLEQAAGKSCQAAAKIHRAARVAPKNRKVKTQMLKLTAKAKNALERARSMQGARAKRAKAVAAEGKCLVPSSSKLHKSLARLAK